jgi:flagellar protein FliS
MFGLNQRGASGYAKVGLETGVLAASPLKLIIMLYEGAITACRGAIVHMKQADIENKGKMLSNAILIIDNGLRLSLDKKAGGEIARSLDDLYIYMSQQLMLANIRNDADMVQAVITLLTELKSAWEEIGKLPAVSAAAANTPAVSNLYNIDTNRSLNSYAKA